MVARATDLQSFSSNNFNKKKIIPQSVNKLIIFIIFTNIIVNRSIEFDVQIFCVLVRNTFFEVP